MSKPASYGLMARLHRKMAEYMEGILDEAMAEPSEDGEDGFAGMPLDAATMGTIRGFLKDNEITCDPAEKDNLDDLREKFSRASQQSRVTTSVSRILEEAKQDDRPYN